MKFLKLSLLFLVTPLLFGICIGNGYVHKKVKCEVLPPRPKTNATVQNNTELAKELDGILTEGGKHLLLKTHSKKAIMIVGNTGSGKTTVSLTMNGDLRNLHTKKTKGGKLVIVDDGDKIGLPSTKSRTLIPEYVVSPNTHAAFYDCPGFDDNRGPAEDIAAMYFVKSILDQLEKAKFLFTVQFNSLQLGGDRNDFDLLTKHAAILLQNMTKFSNSLGLIVTKVPNVDANGEVLEDYELADGFHEFFLDYANVLKDKIRKASKNSEIAYNQRLQRQLQFVQIISAMDKDGDLSKLRIVRNPPQCGPFSEVPRQVQLRYNLINFYNNSLSYVNVSSSDFGLTLKDSTKVTLNEEVLPAIQKSIDEESRLSLEDLKLRYFTNFNSSMNGSDSERIEAVSNLEKHHIQVYSLIQNPSFNQQQLSKKVSSLYNSVEDRVPQAYLDEVEKKENWLLFFEKVTHSNITTIEDNPIFALFLADFIDNFQKAKEQIVQVYIPRITSSIEYDANNVLRKAGEIYLNSYTDQLATFPVESYSGIQKGRTWIRNYQINSNLSAFQELDNVVSYLIQNTFSSTPMDPQMTTSVSNVEKDEMILNSYLELAGLPRNATSSLLKNGIVAVTRSFQNAFEAVRSHLINQLIPEKVAKIQKWIETDVANLWSGYLDIMTERLGKDDMSRVNAIKTIDSHYNELLKAQEDKAFELNTSLADSMTRLANKMDKSFNQISLANLNDEETTLNKVRLDVAIDPEPISIQDAFSKLLLNLTILQKDSHRKMITEWRPSLLDQVKSNVRSRLRDQFKEKLTRLRQGLSSSNIASYIASVQREVDAKRFGEIDGDDEMLKEYDRLSGQATDSTAILDDVIKEEQEKNKKRLEDQLNWYDFVQDLKKKSVTYESQMHLDGLRSSDKLKLLEAKPLNALHSLKIIDVDYNVLSQGEYGGNADETDFEILKQVTDYATGVKTRVECGVVNGRFVKLSEFNGCFSGKSLSIVASDTLFLDADIKENGGNININAPKWVVIGQRSINVDGANGKDNSGKAAQEQDGLAGGPGSTGGSFVGVYNEIVDDSKLTISANGGRGGNGQDGGNGKDGASGSAATWDEFPSAYGSSDSDRFEVVDSSLVYAVVYAHKSFRMRGYPGTSGTNAGNGGKAGTGGNPGSIQLNKEGLINTSSIKGSDGNPGSGGSGGIGGYNGNHYKCTKRGTIPLVVWWDSCESETVLTKASNGSDGIKGGSSKGVY